METEKAVTVNSQCQHIGENGRQCEAKAMSGSPYCWWHNPEVTSRRLDAQRRGGLARHGSMGGPGNYVIENPIDILGVLQDALNSAYALENSATRAKTIAYICRVILDGFEATSIEQRLRGLEERVYKHGKV